MRNQEQPPIEGEPSDQEQKLEQLRKAVSEINQFADTMKDTDSLYGDQLRDMAVAMRMMLDQDQLRIEGKQHGGFPKNAQEQMQNAFKSMGWELKHNPESE